MSRTQLLIGIALLVCLGWLLGRAGRESAVPPELWERQIQEVFSLTSRVEQVRRLLPILDPLDADSLEVSMEALESTFASGGGDPFAVALVMEAWAEVDALAGLRARSRVALRREARRPAAAHACVGAALPGARAGRARWAPRRLHSDRGAARAGARLGGGRARGPLVLPGGSAEGAGPRAPDGDRLQHAAPAQWTGGAADSGGATSRGSGARGLRSQGASIGRHGGRAGRRTAGRGLRRAADGRLPG